MFLFDSVGLGELLVCSGMTERAFGWRAESADCIFERSKNDGVVTAWVVNANRFG